MSSVSDHDLRLGQTGFIGRMIASFTHELRNHLAIIGESAGLQQDMISLGGKSKLDAAEYVKFLKDIEGQVQRALRLISFLNRYAHRLDAEVSTFSVSEALEELVALITRLAYQKRVELRSNLDGSIPAITNNPAVLQLLVYCLFEGQLLALDRKGILTISSSLSGGAVAITIRPEGSRLQVPEKAPYCTAEMVRGFLSVLMATLREDADGSLTVLIPLSEAER